MKKPRALVLSDWQARFVEDFSNSRARLFSMVAPAGAGKTIAALYAAARLEEAQSINKVFLLASRRIIAAQWKQMADSIGQPLTTGGFSELGKAVGTGRNDKLLLIADEPFIGPHSPRDIEVLFRKVLLESPDHRILALSAHPNPSVGFDQEFEYSVVFETRGITRLRAVSQLIIPNAPSFLLLREAQRQQFNLDNMSPRNFERFIGDLLEEDGYKVERMRGTKDGGVDVVATKDLGVVGLFKTLWQAKRKETKYKVGLEMVRELADVRNEFKASKAFIVTTSYLTRGALARIERDKYILGKVDRDDLEAWIDRTLRGEKS